VRGTRAAPRAASPSLLVGKLLDAAGEPLIATHAIKGKPRYRYYVSKALHHGHHPGSAAGMRLPAREIETLVVRHIADAIADPLALLDGDNSRMARIDVPRLIDRARALASRLRDGTSGTVQTLIADLVASITIATGEVRITLDPAGVARHLAIDPASPASSGSRSSTP
jgi:hypothetical protein